LSDEILTPLKLQLYSTKTPAYAASLYYWNIIFQNQLDSFLLILNNCPFAVQISRFSQAPTSAIFPM
jgi:hypothetical protein